VLAGVVLRFVTVSHLWLDEALSVDIAGLPLRDIPAALRRDGHPPLYYVLLHGWMAVFGDGDTTVRALSGVFGVACLPVAWWLADRLAGRRAAWATLAVFAANPFAIRYSTETRMYSLVTLLVLVGWALLVLVVEQPSVARCGLLALTTGLLLLTHYWGLWLTGATLVVLGAQWLWSRRHDQAGPARRTLLAGGSIAAGGLLLVPWLPSMLSQSAHTGTPWAAPVRPTTMVSTLLTDVGGGRFAEGLLLGGALAILILVAACAVPRGEGVLEVDLRTVPGLRRPLAVAALTLAIATVVGYMINSTFVPRYGATVLPMLLVAAGVGLTRVGEREVLAVVGAVVMALSGVAVVHNAGTDRTQAGAIGAAITAGSQPGDVVVLCPDQLGPSTVRYLPDGLAALAYPTLGDPRFVDWRDYAERNARAEPAAVAAEVLRRTPPTARIWLVASGGYRTLDGQCEALHAALGKTRPSVGLVAEDGAVFEHGLLVRLDPAPAASPG
jgi:uncharacterized membrane protein